MRQVILPSLTSPTGGAGADCGFPSPHAALLGGSAFTPPPGGCLAPLRETPANISAVQTRRPLRRSGLPQMRWLVTAAAESTTVVFATVRIDGGGLLSIDAVASRPSIGF